MWNSSETIHKCVVIEYLNEMFGKMHEQNSAILMRNNIAAYEYVFPYNLSIGECIYRRCKVEGWEKDPSAWVFIVGGTRAWIESGKFVDSVYGIQVHKGWGWTGEDPFPDSNYKAVYEFYAHGGRAFEKLVDVNMNEGYVSFIEECEEMMRKYIKILVRKLGEIVMRGKKEWGKNPRSMEEVFRRLKEGMAEKIAPEEHN